MTSTTIATAITRTTRNTTVDPPRQHPAYVRGDTRCRPEKRPAGRGCAIDAVDRQLIDLLRAHHPPSPSPPPPPPPPHLRGARPPGRSLLARRARAGGQARGGRGHHR